MIVRKLQPRLRLAGLVLLALMLVGLTAAPPAHAAVPNLQGKFFNISFSSAHGIDARLSITAQNANGSFGGTFENMANGTVSQAFGTITQAQTGGYMISFSALNCSPQFWFQGCLQVETDPAHT